MERLLRLTTDSSNGGNKLPRKCSFLSSFASSICLKRSEDYYPTLFIQNVYRKARKKFFSRFSLIQKLAQQIQYHFQRFALLPEGLKVSGERFKVRCAFHFMSFVFEDLHVFLCNVYVVIS